MTKSIMVIAGETSGDMHAARVIREIKKSQPNIKFWGIGGDEMASCDVKLEEHVRNMDVMGFSEVLRKYFHFRKIFKRMLKLAAERKPDAVLLVDYPGFNLRFARAAKRLNLKVIYYICPQVWAWHRSRIGKMAQIIDRLLVIFPFEKEIFDGTGLHVDFVGHPLVETIRRLKESRQEELPWRGVKRVALLPGSRRQEVERILPSIWEAARLLEEKDPGISFILATPSSVIESIARNTISNITKNPERVEFVVGKTRHVLWQAQAAIVASGTATIEAALMRCPMVIVYCVSGITYWLGRKLIKIPYIGMVNIVADRELCPEFIQHDADPVRIAAAMGVILKDGSKRENMLAGLDSVADKLSVENAIEKSAAVILDELGLSAS